jgi:multiple antibiotic resistance protein
MSTSLNLADTFITFLALLGPQKVLLSFAQLARSLDVRSLRLVAMATSVTAAIVGTLCAMTAPWLATFFHIGPGALAVASGIVFFVYAVGLVLGVHFDHAEASVKAIPDGERYPRDEADRGEEDEEDEEEADLDQAELDEHDTGVEAGRGEHEAVEADPSHPVMSGFRVMLLPFVVSPLAVAADLEVSLSAHSWGARWIIAGAFALVAVADAICALVFAPLLRRTHESILEVLSRLLGILLAAVGVQLFLEGLDILGVHVGH